MYAFIIIKKTLITLYKLFINSVNKVKKKILFQHTKKYNKIKIYFNVHKKCNKSMLLRV